MLRLLTCAAACLALLAFVPPASAAWVWPLRGEVITPYSNGDDPYAAGRHRGIDIAGETGRPVVAAAGGTVRFAGTVGSSGLTVSIRTADGFDTSYLHLSSALVRAGQPVSAGERIGAVGTSGVRSAERPHLHFGVREAGSRHAYRDPLLLLPAPPVFDGLVADPGPAPAPAPLAAPPGPVPSPAPAAPAGTRAAGPLRDRPLAGRAPVGGSSRVPAADNTPARPSPVHPSELGPERRPALAREQPSGRAARPAPGRALSGSEAPSRSPSAVTHPRSAPHSYGPSAFASGRAAAQTAGPRRSSPAAAVHDFLNRAGPDLGLVLACLGLLGAAALLGLSEEGRAATRHGGRRAARVLRPLLMRR